MPTYTSAGSSIVANTGSWATTTNVYVSDNTYATNTGATQNTEYAMEIGGFNLSAIPSGSVIASVTVTIEAKTGTANRAQIKGELLDGATLLGTLALTNLTAADVNYTFTGTATEAQLKSANLKVRVTNKRTVTQASTTSLDYVKIDVVVPSKAETLTDTFDTLDTATKWNTFGTPSATAGQLVLPSTGTAYSGVSSKNAFDLTESSVYVKAIPPPTPSVSRETSFAMYDTGNVNGMGMYVLTTTPDLMMRLRQASTNNETSISPYNPVAHAWFRMRIVGSTGYWDTSPDGITWTNRRTAALTPANFRALTVELSVGQWSDLGASTGYMDNLNVPPVVTTGRPKVWTGSAWAQKPAKVWTGSAWVEKPVKVWTGSSWKVLT